MTEKTLSLLEFYKLQKEIAAFCVSQEGREELLRRLPSAKTEEVSRLKRLALGWSRETESKNPPPLSSWQPVAGIFHVLKAKGAVVSAESCLKLGGFCAASEAMRLWGKGKKENEESGGGEPVRAMAAALPDLSEARSAIFSVIDETGAFRELPRLAAIKRRIAETRRAIERRLSALCGDPAVRPALQSFLPVLRGGRQALAVKASFRGRVPGIVHEVSQSGQTIYVEPADVVEAGNVLVNEEFRLEREKKEALRGLAESLKAFCPSFKAALKALILFDTLAAACTWGKETNSAFALDLPQAGEAAGDEGGGGCRVNLVKARHPFLREKAVPIDISIPEGSTALIITGPNAGGKTVALKTAGLFALANQCGWPVPAADGSALPVFDFIGCDMGDDQSIEDSLSTFSARMKSAAGMLKKATAKSLILLDELGSGTDPEEGSCLAMALLDELSKKGALAIATTHCSALKHYGFAREGCAIASVEFNAETLSPSYKILMGMPGESRAIDIAERSGIPQEVAAAARSYLSGGGADVALLVQKLASKHEEMIKIEEELQKKDAALKEMKRELDLRELRLKQKELRLRGDEYGRMRSFFLESRKNLENLVREIKESGGAVPREETLAAKSWAEGFEKRLEVERDALQAEAAEVEAASKAEMPPDGKPAGGAARLQAIAPGVEVRIAPSGALGKVLRRGKKGSWIVETGSLKVTMPESALTAAGGAPSSGGRAASLVELQGAVSSEKPAFELRLLGMRRADAEQALIHQIDLCVMAGLREFSVIHGKGNGVLQEAVAAVLKSSPAVAEFGFARPENGGTGKTIVRLALP